MLAARSLAYLLVLVAPVSPQQAPDQSPTAEVANGEISIRFCMS